MSLTRSFNVQGAILKVWCLVPLLSCLVKADQYDKTFDPFTRRTLSGDSGHGHGHVAPGHPVIHADGTCPNYKPFDVSKYGNAKGDGKTDDTQAFLAAWKDVCTCPTAAKLFIPKGTWLTAELDFRGPCTAPSVLMELQGTLLAKPDQQAFPKGYWINVIGVQNFVLNGGGTLNAQGEHIWHLRAIGEKGKPLPDSLVLAQSNNSRIENVFFVNAKGFNMKVFENENVTICNVHITSPGDSPNTDGIHVGRLRNVHISDSTIAVGDDCVSIGDGSIDITVKNILCGPGHGISVGSLGRFPYETDVRNIFVDNCTFVKTLNGARIKTFHDSPKLVADNITFQNLIMHDVYNPIIIDQNYASMKPVPSRVKISNIFFKNIKGTTWSNIAVSLNCSSSVPCDHIELSDIDLKYTGNNTVDKIAHSACANVHPKLGGVMNPPGCK
ncbi:polygalacturonase-like [Heracleum sosnowskyi]|uniref:Polygalacturonase-like n=1 Tax=Heracleum sosnowskyi TaxID=360622 RepID=A0AAD8HVX3_9APIA|nr:polygalacturonase-like [Heracleum sosnowskyi]